jgi:hypothetical protein
MKAVLVFVLSLLSFLLSVLSDFLPDGTKGLLIAQAYDNDGNLNDFVALASGFTEVATRPVLSSSLFRDRVGLEALTCV